MPKNYNPDYFFNRELSWIEFNKRVLEEACDPTQPLLERVKFLSIFCTNLDEFFMIRVAGLKRQVTSGVNELTSDGMSAQEQRGDIFNNLCLLVHDLYKQYNDEIVPKLEENGIRFYKYDELDESDREKVNKYFDEVLFLVLTPIAIDNAHPFPTLVNRTLALAVILDDPDTEEIEERFTVLQVPSNFPRFHYLKGKEGYNFILLEEIIKANIHKLFPGMKVLESYAFRITRNADIELEEDEAEDLLKLIEEEVKKRRLGIAVRLEVDKNMPEKFLNFLADDLHLEKKDIYKIDGPINLGDLMNIYKIDERILKDEPFTPRIASIFREEEDFFKAIKKQDIFLHHPFYSFSSVSEFIAQAAEDDNVAAIKMTLYRTSGDSPIIKSLIEAAENGKQVTALVELKARFDEENNIVWAKALENSGVHVVYGVSGLKTHCKMALVVRKESGGMKRYLHLGTGNYNPITAKIYTDFGFFTTDEDFCSDSSNLFNYLTGYSKFRDYKKFIAAPFAMRKGVIKLIDEEINSHRQNGNGYILAKMNALVDEHIIVKLYEASQAGVKIEMLVRGICCLKPNVQGLSENINVYSIVGRFLEHSRAFYFYNNGNPVLYSGSADWMPRNFDRRVEIFFPIDDKTIKQEVFDILQSYLKDNVKTRILNADGTYSRKLPDTSLPESEVVNLNIQEYFLKKVKKKTEAELKKAHRKKIKKKKKDINDKKK
ncbi:MAG TPA: polyphosphate kinase 1 [Ignavibacteria bacterium]